MTHNLCANCGHDLVFHRVGTGNGVPRGVTYCDDRHDRPCWCTKFAAMPKRAAPSIYVMGSMRNAKVPEVAKLLRTQGWDAFDDWYSPGPETDDKWQEYERLRGRTYKEAIYGHHAVDVFEFDKRHLDRCEVGVLVLPAGKSAHIELGYLIGCGKKAYILLDGEPERFDLMYQFATGIFTSVEEMLSVLK